jgi:hypothetical protein
MDISEGPVYHHRPLIHVLLLQLQLGPGIN